MLARAPYAASPSPMIARDHGNEIDQSVEEAEYNKNLLPQIEDDGEPENVEGKMMLQNLLEEEAADILNQISSKMNES